MRFEDTAFIPKGSSTHEVDRILKQVGNVDIVHHFTSGVYAKEVKVPAGSKLCQHIHNFDHMSVLASGTAKINVDGVDAVLTGPKCLTIEANKQHSVEALTDVVWFCIHATDHTDVDNVDMTLIGERCNA
jgi:quercetin dioxygenase-like cupin family protein